MRKFNEPSLEIITFKVNDVVTASGGPSCDQGMENTGWGCVGDMVVTCATAISKMA